MEWYFKVLSNYAGFSGRARRKEYWMFFLFNVIIAFFLGIIDGLLKARILGSLYTLAVFLPSLAAAVRRLHDTGHSGWWVLVPCVNFVFLVSEGDSETNEYGPNPKLYGPLS